jgi:phosphoadenosine phosphosulfate reductase
MQPDPAHLLLKNTPAGGSKTSGGAPNADLNDRVAALNTAYRHHSATDVVRAALRDLGHIALVSSFGAESVALLHLVAMQDRAAPVVFIDTEMLFTQTLVYQQEVAEKLGLRNVRIIRAANAGVADLDGTLHKTDPDACCTLRKTAPLDQVLAEYDGWITGRKRFQSGRRATLEFFEAEPETGRIKINPLAHWTAADVQTYMIENRLPRHPLVAQGYPSIGCAPCTSPVAADENPRAGRWRDQTKDECGIHFVNGKLVRTGEAT